MSPYYFCPLCGPKVSLICMAMSVFGAIFLTVLGIGFYRESVLLFDTLFMPLSEQDKNNHPPGWPDHNTIMDRYWSAALQCWIAAGAYTVTFIVVVIQNRFNKSIPRKIAID